jgi:DNA-binding CsgD family transcriptional regulator
LGNDTEVLWGGCVHFGEASVPFAPVASALQAWLARADAAARTEVFAGAEDLGTLLPALSTGDHRPSQPGRLLALIDMVLNRLAERKPTVLVIDDLHWADRTSLDTLAYVITGFRHQRLALLATCRDEHRGAGHPLHGWLADLRRMPMFKEIHLDRLDLAATESQIQLVLGHAVDIEFAAQIHERSCGNPYLTELLVRGLTGDEPKPPTTVPAVLREALLAGWHGLSVDARQATRVLAVGGRPIDFAVLAGVAAEHGIPREALVTCLIEAEDHGVVRHDDAGRAWFRHPLIAEALHAALPPGEAATMHADYVRTLESQPESPLGPLAADLAIHNQQAGRIDETYNWSLAAADYADSLHAAAELSLHLERACSLWDRVSPSLRGEQAERVALLRRASQASDRAGRLESAIALAEQAMELVDRGRDPLHFSTLLREWSLVYLRHLAPGRIMHAAHTEGIELTQPFPDSPEHARALASLSMAEYWDGLQDSAAAHAEQAVQAANRSGSRAALADALIARSRTTRDAMESLADAEEAEVLARICDDSLLVEDAAMWRVGRLRLLGRISDSIEVAHQAFRDVLAAGSLQWGYYLAAQAADGMLQLGRWQECRELLRTALAARCGGIPGAAVRLSAARLAVRSGHLTEAKGHLARVLELVSPTYPILVRQLGEVTAEVLAACGEPMRALEGLHGRVVAPHAEAALHRDETLAILGHIAAEAAVAARDLDDASGARRAATLLEEVIDNWPEEPFAGRRRDVVNQAAFRALFAAEAARCRRDVGQVELWRRAIEKCDLAGWPWEKAVSRLRCAEALVADGSSGSAVNDLLRPAHATAEELGALPLRDQVESLARIIRVPLRQPTPIADTSRSPTPLTGLTTREREVLALLVAGRSNGEIAKDLFISHRTASVHVSNILRKTGTSSRVEAAALADRLAGRHPLQEDPD